MADYTVDLRWNPRKWAFTSARLRRKVRGALRYSPHTLDHGSSDTTRLLERVNGPEGHDLLRGRQVIVAHEDEVLDTYEGPVDGRRQRRDA